MKHPYLVTPLIDDRHVDIIYENGHFLPCRRSICGAHPLIHIALNCPLQEKTRAIKKKHGDKKRQQKVRKRERQDRSIKFHSDIIHCDSLINGQLNHVQKKRQRFFLQPAHCSSDQTSINMTSQVHDNP